MAAATLSMNLVSGTTYTSFTTTAMPQIAQTGEVLFVSQGLTNVEQFVVSSPISIGDTTIHVNSHQAANNHSIGENVAPKYTLTAIGRTLAPEPVPRMKRA